MKKMKVVWALSLGLAMLTQSAQAVKVTPEYIIASKAEMYPLFGGYINPAVYIDSYGCGEPELTAYACGAYRMSVGTAFLQGIETQYGHYTTKMILAHEWGHNIQAAKSINYPAPYAELQADCFAGAFINYASNYLGYSNFLNAGVSAVRAYAGGHHGTPAQRDYYTRWGYAYGPENCMSYMPRV